MTDNKIVSDEEWLAARTDLLAKEKEFNRLRDELTAQRQNLPWRKISKDYQLETATGTQSLVDLFAGRKAVARLPLYVLDQTGRKVAPAVLFWADNLQWHRHSPCTPRHHFARHLEHIAEQTLKRNKARNGLDVRLGVLDGE